MQENSDKLVMNQRKVQLLEAIGNVVYRHRKNINKGINIFSYEFDIGNGLLSGLEKGCSDVRITTLWKIANAFGYKFSDFIREIEKELPENFNFYLD